MSNPILGPENYLERDDVAITSTQLGAGSSLDHMLNPNLTAITDLGLGETISLVVTLDVALAPTLFYVRFRGAAGWLDIEKIRLRVSANSDLSTPDLDYDLLAQFPSPWPSPDVLPVRPQMLHRWTAEPSRLYYGIDFVRTTGDVPLEVAYLYLGSSIELVDDSGHAVHQGSQKMVEDNSEQFFSALQADMTVRGSSRRIVPTKIVGMPYATVLDEWHPVLYGAAGGPVVYWNNSDETSARRIQEFAFLATMTVGEPQAVVGSENGLWEQDATFREILG